MDHKIRPSDLIMKHSLFSDNNELHVKVVISKRNFCEPIRLTQAGNVFDITFKNLELCDEPMFDFLRYETGFIRPPSLMQLIKLLFFFDVNHIHINACIRGAFEIEPGFK